MQIPSKQYPKRITKITMNLKGAEVLTVFTRVHGFKKKVDSPRPSCWILVDSSWISEFDWYVFNLHIYTLKVQDQTKNGLQDDPCKGFPTTKRQSLVFGLPGYIYIYIYIVPAYNGLKPGFYSGFIWRGFPEVPVNLYRTTPVICFVQKDPSYLPPAIPTLKGFHRCF